MSQKHREELVDVVRHLARAERAGDERNPVEQYSRRSFLKGGVATAAAALTPWDLLGSGASVSCFGHF